MHARAMHVACFPLPQTMAARHYLSAGHLVWEFTTFSGGRLWTNETETLRLDVDSLQSQTAF